MTVQPSIRFVVYGVACPKGSVKAFIPKGWKRPILTSTTRGLKDWERKIASAAQAKATGVLLTGPVTMSIAFYLSRPMSMPKRVRFHIKRPDLDKLARGAIDALTGVIWKDDAQVIEISAEKHYTFHKDDAPRAVFIITPVAEDEGLK